MVRWFGNGDWCGCTVWSAGVCEDEEEEVVDFAEFRRATVKYLRVGIRPILSAVATAGSGCRFATSLCSQLHACDRVVVPAWPCENLLLPWFRLGS